MRRIIIRCCNAGRAAISLAGLIFFCCNRPATVTGLLELKPGSAGHITNCRVELLPDSFALPVASVSALPASVPFRATFFIKHVPAGTYFLRALQDSDSVPEISDGDLVGVYREASFLDTMGEPFWVSPGQTLDLGRIELRRFQKLLITASGSRRQNLTKTDFWYSFNHHIELLSLVIAFPMIGRYVDAGAAGPKHPDTTYSSVGWGFGGMSMPAGIHQLDFRGQFLQDTFRITVPVFVE